MPKTAEELVSTYNIIPMVNHAIGQLIVDKVALRRLANFVEISRLSYGHMFHKSSIRTSDRRL